MGPHVVDHDFVHGVLADGDCVRAAELVSAVHAVARIDAILDGQRRIRERDVGARELRIDEGLQFARGFFERAADGEVGRDVDAGGGQVLGLTGGRGLLQRLLRFSGGELALFGAASERYDEGHSEQAQRTVHGPRRCSRHASQIRLESRGF